MSDNSEKVKKPIYKKWWFWLIVVIVVVAISSSSNDTNTTNPTSSSTSTESNETIEYTVVDIDELEDALTNNAAAAKDKYKGKYLEIKGRLGTIDSDLKYISLLSITDEWDISGIHCSIKNNEQKEVVKTLSKDQTITIKGKITDVGEVLGYYLDIIEISK